MNIRKDRDLHQPIPEVVLKSQKIPSGQMYILEQQGILHEFLHEDRYERAERFDAKLNAELNWIEKFTSHAPSVGTHYEKLLSDLLKEFLPSSLTVATGFVYDSFTSKVSPQIDILVYDGTQIAPIYKRDDFVIVQPECVKIACEVKKTLVCSELEKWTSRIATCNLGWWPSMPTGFQSAKIFGYSCNAKTKTIVKTLTSSLKRYAQAFHSKTVAGNSVLIALNQCSLPEIYLKDREEHISVSISQNPEKSREGFLKISVLRGRGPKGIGAFLGGITGILEPKDPSSKDHCSCYLLDPVSETMIDIPLMPFSSMTSSEMLRRFPDAKSILLKNRVYGASFSSFVNPSDFTTLREFASKSGFRWKHLPAHKTEFEGNAASLPSEPPTSS